MADIVARLGVDVFSAGISAATIGPVIFMIDKSIMEAASGKADSITSSISASAKSLVKRPFRFLTSVPFLLLYSVYFTTYTTANCFDTISSYETEDLADWAKQQSSFGKFLTTTAFNLSVCVFKDMKYTKLYGVGVPRKMPPSSLMLFAARDSLTVFASFNIPPLLAPAFGLNAAQLFTPCAMQLLSTPLHLLGLDLYNRELETTRSRLKTVKANYWKSTLARMCRILPAFGIGGVLNREVRTQSMAVMHDRIKPHRAIMTKSDA